MSQTSKESCIFCAITLLSECLIRVVISFYKDNKSFPTDIRNKDVNAFADIFSASESEDVKKIKDLMKTLLNE